MRNIHSQTMTIYKYVLVHLKVNNELNKKCNRDPLDTTIQNPGQAGTCDQLSVLSTVQRYGLPINI